MKIEIYTDYIINELGGISIPSNTCTIDLKNPEDYIYENTEKGIYLIKKDSKCKFDIDNTRYWFPNRDYYKLSKDIIDKTVFNSTNKKIEKKHKRKILKGIICLLFGHDWVSYNEHAWICSRCMAVAPKS